MGPCLWTVSMMQSTSNPTHSSCTRIWWPNCQKSAFLFCYQFTENEQNTERHVHTMGKQIWEQEGKKRELSRQQDTNKKIENGRKAQIASSRKRQTYKEGQEKTRCQPQREATKCNTPAEVFHSPPFFCYSVNLWSQEDIVHYSHSSISIPLPALYSVYSAFHTNCQFAVLWKERSCFLLSLLFSLSLTKYTVKRVDYWMALKLLFCLLISQSTSLSLHHSSFIFGLSLTRPLPPLFI